MPKENKRGYSKLQIKQINEDKREFVGVASTLTPDRDQDIVVPSGAVFKLPLPLLWEHDRYDPVGEVVKAEIKDDQILVTCRLPKIEAPSQLAARLDEAWERIKSGLVKGLSVGFRPREYSFLDESDGIKFTEWEWYELSLVSIPANAEATIQTIKSIAKQAASGKQQKQQTKTKPLSGVKSVSITEPNKGNSMTYQEMIKRLQATLAEKQAEREAIQKAVSDEGRTKFAEEREAFDTLSDEIKALQLEVNDYQKLEKENMKAAKPVAGPEGAQVPEQSNQYSGIAVKAAPEKLEKGIAFARFAAAMGAAKGQLNTAESIAKARFPDDKRLHHIMKTAVAAGTTQDPEWAGNLVEYNEISSDFVEFLRPRTIVGRFGTEGIPALRSLPFNVHIKGQSSGGTAGWVGEGKAKPVTKSGYSDTYLGFTKIAAISVASDELLRFSNPSAERLIRDDLAAAVIEQMDQSFIGISSVAIANVKPASITSSIGATYPTGTTSPEADIAALWAAADSGNLDLTSAVYITTPAIARLLTGMSTMADNKRFPNMTPRGGSIDGIPVLVSNYVDTGAFVLAFAGEIWLADDGIVTLDASREASILMDSAPQTAIDAAMDSGADVDALQAAQLVSMYQTNQVALRAERYVNWALRRTGVVSGVTATNWA